MGKGFLIAFWCVAAPTLALAQEEEPLNGVWAAARGGVDYCKAYADGELDGMSRALASDSGLVEIKGRLMEWLYSASSCNLKSLDGGPIRFLAEADCEFKGEPYPTNITFTLSGLSKLNIDFSNKDFWTAATSSYVRCKQ